MIKNQAWETTEGSIEGQIGDLTVMWSGEMLQGSRSGLGGYWDNKQVDEVGILIEEHGAQQGGLSWAERRKVSWTKGELLWDNEGP